MAGNSIRYGKRYNKNFEVIHGKHIVQYSLDIFNQNERVDDIVLVVKKGEQVGHLLERAALAKKVEVVGGGATRRESVYAGIKATAADIVLTHDGARPLVKSRYIDELLGRMSAYKGAAVGVKAKDTVKIADEKQVVRQTTLRSHTWMIQTPQCFHRNTLLEAHEQAGDGTEVTDDCMLLEQMGLDVVIVEGEYSNIKLTTIEDYDIISRLVDTGF